MNKVYHKVAREVADGDALEEQKSVPIEVSFPVKYKYPEEKPNTVKIRGTNIGVHTGGTSSPETENWGTLLTPQIMKWTRDVIINKNFWKGTYESEFQIGIGSEGIPGVFSKEHPEPEDRFQLWLPEEAYKYFGLPNEVLYKGPGKVGDKDNK